MTDINKPNDNEFIDKNLDSLLEQGKPIPMMPEDLKNRIRTTLIQMEPESAKQYIFSFRWVVLPLAAAAVLIFFLIFPWQGNLTGSVTWADVQKQLNQIRTMTSNICSQLEMTGFAGDQKINFCGKAYCKDPLLRRVETDVLTSGGFGAKPGSKVTVIVKRESGRIGLLVLDHGAQKAELQTCLFDTDDNHEPPFQSVLNATAKSWEHFKKISEDETKRIGDRVINGIPAVGFSIGTRPSKKIKFIDNSTVIKSSIISGELWVSRSDGTPIEAELVVKFSLNNNTRIVKNSYTDMQWDVPMEDDLFNLDIPEGWQTKRTHDYDNNNFTSGITLSISTVDQKWKITDKDVTGVVNAVETSYPGSNRLRDVKVTIELNKEASKYLYNKVNTTKELFLIGEFNNELNMIAKPDKDNPNQLTLYLSGLRLSLAEIEKKYFTKTSVND